MEVQINSATNIQQLHSMGNGGGRGIQRTDGVVVGNPESVIDREAGQVIRRSFLFGIPFSDLSIC
jgi:hypothetical protein